MRGEIANFWGKLELRAETVVGWHPLKRRGADAIVYPGLRGLFVGVRLS